MYLDKMELEEAEALMTFDFIASKLDSIANKSHKASLRQRLNSHRDTSSEMFFLNKKLKEDLEQAKMSYLENRELLLKHRQHIVSFHAYPTKYAISMLNNMEKLIQEDLEKALFGDE